GELWFTGDKTAMTAGALHGVTLNGATREILRVPARLVLHDIYRTGTVLDARSDLRLEARGEAPGETGERDLSWLDFSGLSDLTPDGGTIVITEYGESGLHGYLRKTDGSPAVQVGEEGIFGLSPDGRWTISLSVRPPPLRLSPIGAGH